MAYVLVSNRDHPDPALKRLDHLICRALDMENGHDQFVNELGFTDSWPKGIDPDIRII